MTDRDDGVSVVVRRRIHPDQVDEFEDWLSGVIDAASQFDGHQGAQVLRPPDPAVQDYVLLFRYATPEQLAAWQDSDTARDWLRRAEAYTIGDVQIQKMTGLEFWFKAPAGAGVRPPPRHKMVIATVTGLYPLILLVAPILTTALEILPRPFAVLVSTMCMVLMMTYAAMPLVTRVLSRWLYPH